MKIKRLITMLTIACLLVVAISPLVARNTPYPEKFRGDTAAHPWQDDNQYNVSVPELLIEVPLGPIIITVHIPHSWISQYLTKTTASNPKSVTKVKTARPMSLDQKGETR
jgi:hypothetical protein